jgi:hypothetical protein
MENKNTTQEQLKRTTPAGGSLGWHFKKCHGIYSKIWPYRTIDQTPITKEEFCGIFLDQKR